MLPEADIAVTVDQQIEGVHFPPGLPAGMVARRLVAVNLSDIAAVGGRPTHAVMTIAAPPGFDAKPLLGTVERELWHHGALLAGGDLARSDRLTTSLTLLATRTPRGRWVRRSNARPGDRLWIGGTVGESALGRMLLASGASIEGNRVALAETHRGPGTTTRALTRAVRRHLRPAPQLELGAWLATRRRAAAIDISDGLLMDAHRLCRASRLGAVIEAAALPLGERFAESATVVGADPMELALAGGEDYVLLFALPANRRPPARFGARAVGRLVEGSEIELVGADLPARRGWDHFDIAQR